MQTSLAFCVESSKRHGLVEANLDFSVQPLCSLATSHGFAHLPWPVVSVCRYVPKGKVTPRYKHEIGGLTFKDCAHRFGQ
jgi:hypothetical protein